MSSTTWSRLSGLNPGINPDASTDVDAQPTAAPPSPAPSMYPNSPDLDASVRTTVDAPVAQAPAEKPTSMWRAMLAGALNGLAGSAGAQSFGAGLAGGAAGQFAGEQRQIINRQNQQQIDQRGLAIKFANEEAAKRIAIASADETRRAQLFKEHQVEHDNQNAETLASYQKLGVQPVLLTTDTNADATEALKKAGAMYPNGIPPLQTLQVGDQIYVFDPAKVVQAQSEKARQLVNDAMFRQTGKRETFDGNQWLSMPDAVKAVQVDKAMSYNRLDPSSDLTPQNVDAAIARTSNEIALFKYNAQHSGSPDVDSILAEKQRELNLYKGYRKQLDENLDKAAQRQADVKVQAIEAQKAAENVASSSIAQQLVDGLMDPSQLSKRGSTYNAILTAAQSYSQQKYGKPFDVAQAQSDYKFATNANTQNTLRYLNSLTGADGKGGNLAALVQLSDKIGRTDFPALNNVEAWAKLQAGSPEIAQYYATITEVSDQVAKILQGGGTGAGTSDAKLKQASELFNKSFSAAQIKGVAYSLNTLLGNRKSELIGNNRYLQRQFGSGESVANPSAPPQRQPQEGDIIRNSQTGQRLQLKGGQWQPIQ
jgi:hypothetical protein